MAQDFSDLLALVYFICEATGTFYSFVYIQKTVVERTSTILVRRIKMVEHLKVEALSHVQKPAHEFVK